MDRNSRHLWPSENTNLLASGSQSYYSGVRKHISERKTNQRLGFTHKCFEKSDQSTYYDYFQLFRWPGERIKFTKEYWCGYCILKFRVPQMLHSGPGLTLLACIDSVTRKIDIFLWSSWTLCLIILSLLTLSSRQMRSSLSLKKCQTLRDLSINNLLRKKCFITAPGIMSTMWKEHGAGLTSVYQTKHERRLGKSWKGFFRVPWHTCSFLRIFTGKLLLWDDVHPRN